MPPLSVVRAANITLAPKYRPTALFVGGTSGIGQAIAEAFASATNGNAHIIISGRNKSAAEDIIRSFPTPPKPATSTYEFEPCDASLMSNVRTTAASLRARLDKLNYLVLSPGFLSFSGRDETSEGIDKKLAVHYYARWQFIRELLPLLEKAKARGEDARVLTILGAGINRRIDETDLGLKRGYGLKAAADHATSMNDYMCEDFAAQHPDISFIHAAPGGVRTQWLNNFHWSLKPLTYLAVPFTISPADCGQWMLYILFDPELSSGAFFRNSHADDAGRNKQSTPELRKLVWEHTLKMTGETGQ